MSTGTIPTFQLPAPGFDQAFIHVSALEAGMLDLPTWEVVSDAGEDEVLHIPSLAFYLKHSKTGKTLLFDLGIRRGQEERDMSVVVKQTASEALRKGGVDPKEIDTVVLSHVHWDHVGDSADFPNATFILGPGSAPLIEADHPEMWIIPSSVPTDRARILSANSFPTSIGPFPQALDYFEDGSLYIVNAEGHLPGHINVFARTSAEGAWVCLAGDTAHDVRLLTGEKEMTYTHDAKGLVVCCHEHKESAQEHINRVGSLLKVPRVQVLIAHDWEWFEKHRDGEAFFPGRIPPKQD